MANDNKLYRRWWNMITRCKYPSTRCYQNYGGRGIKVCYEWDNKNPNGYENFEKWIIAQGYDASLPTGAQTLDRIDVNGNYCPENCRIISRAEQNANTRKNVYVTYSGETHHIAEWERILGFPKGKIARRLYRGMSFEEAISTPTKPTNIKYDFIYNGKRYKSLTELANDYSLSMKRISYLIHKGLTVNEVMQQELNK